MAKIINRFPVRWKAVQDDGDRETTRLEVPGGWIYVVIEKGEIGGIINQMAVFVPTQPKESGHGLTSR